MKHVILALLAACAASSNPPARPAPAPASSRSNATIECSAGDQAGQAAVYCVHVKDACCSGEGWTCNNARYIEWFREYCRN